MDKRRAYLFLRFILLLLLLAGFELWTRPILLSDSSIKVFDRHGLLLYETFHTSGRRSLIKIATLPKYVLDAVIASEDATYWRNPGFDPKAMLRALWQNFTGGQIVSGASTITQKLVRQSYPQSRFIVLRKLREIFSAARLTLFSSKKTILEHYLNSIYFGAQSYGIEAASQTYFAKPSSNLSLAEASLLAGLIASPEVRSPYANPAESLKFQHLILDRMQTLGFITSTQKTEAQNEKLSLQNFDHAIKAPHFIHYVLDQLLKLNLSTQNGLNIYTTLDYSQYELAREIAISQVNKLKDRHDLTNAAVVLLDNYTGEILVFLGGINYFDIQNQGQVDMAKALRQPGSALKPITYAAAFSQNRTPATLIYDIPKVFLTKKNEGFKPQNYDGRYHGMVLARTALASSYNLPAVEILSQIGLPSFFETSLNLGITSFTDVQNLDLAVTLGGGEVSLLELTNAYASFARSGHYLPVHSIDHITTPSGKKLYQHQPSTPKPVFPQNSAQISYLITDILSDPKARIPTYGEKNSLVLDHPAAVKTGTTSDWHDNWTVGYTPSYTLGVWVGNNDNHPMRQITGVVGAAPIWNQYFSEFLKTKPKENFSRPENIIDLEICSFDGKLPIPNCPEVYTEKFIAGTEPTAKTQYPIYPPEVYTYITSHNLSQNPSPQDSSPSSPAAIVFPVNNSRFQTAPDMVTRESLVFQINVPPNTQSVSWYLNGKLLGISTKFPYSFSWQPIPGNYSVFAKSANFTTPAISFSVTQYPN